VRTIGWARSHRQCLAGERHALRVIGEGRAGTADPSGRSC
jgi:hypothetical protein